jgi:hypothetical protein
MRDEFGPSVDEGDIDVRRCQSGYAQAFLSGGPETEQVFLGWSDGSWAVLEYGTGISCDDEEWLAAGAHEQTRTICAALGYPPP